MEKYCYQDKGRKCDETCAALQMFDGCWSCSAIRARITPSSVGEVRNGTS